MAGLVLGRWVDDTRRVLPTRRAFIGVLTLLPLAVVPAFAGAGAWLPWLAAVGVFALLLAIDAALTPPADQLEVRLDAPLAAPVGTPFDVRLLIAPGRLRHTLRLETRLETAVGLVPPPHTTVTVARGTPSTLAPLTLTPTRRGPTAAETLYLRWAGPLGLVGRQTAIACETPIAVTLPTLRQHGPTARLLHRGAFSGARIERHRGDGSEFDTLAEYTAGHDHRRIDWKASARLHAPLVRECRAERNRDVIIAIDTGHLMAEPLGPMPRLDHAILSAQLIALAAARGGDRVGLFAFDERPRIFLPPAPGLAAYHAVARATAELDETRTETNFTRGLLHLVGTLRRRSLIILLTDFIDATTATIMLEHLERLGRRHLLVLAVLRDDGAGAAFTAVPDTTTALHAAVAENALKRERETVFARLRRAGAHVLEADADALAGGLLAKYLELKRRERF